MWITPFAVRMSSASRAVVRILGSGVRPRKCSRLWETSPPASEALPPGSLRSAAAGAAALERAERAALPRVAGRCACASEPLLRGASSASAAWASEPLRGERSPRTSAWASEPWPREERTACASAGASELLLLLGERSACASTAEEPRGGRGERAPRGAAGRGSARSDSAALAPSLPRGSDSGSGGGAQAAPRVRAAVSVLPPPGEELGAAVGPVARAPSDHGAEGPSPARGAGAGVDIDIMVLSCAIKLGVEDALSSLTKARPALLPASVSKAVPAPRLRIVKVAAPRRPAKTRTFRCWHSSRPGQGPPPAAPAASTLTWGSAWLSSNSV